MIFESGLPFWFGSSERKWTVGVDIYSLGFFFFFKSIFMDALLCVVVIVGGR